MCTKFEKNTKKWFHKRILKNTEILMKCCDVCGNYLIREREK